MDDDKRPTDWPRLFGLAAYELTTPLAVVRGYAGILQSPKMDASREERHNIYVKLARAAEQAGRVADTMRELEAFETGRRWTAVGRRARRLRSEFTPDASNQSSFVATTGGRIKPCVNPPAHVDVFADDENPAVQVL